MNNSPTIYNEDNFVIGSTSFREKLNNAEISIGRADVIKRLVSEVLNHSLIKKDIPTDVIAHGVIIENYQAYIEDGLKNKHSTIFGRLTGLSVINILGKSYLSAELLTNRYDQVSDGEVQNLIISEEPEYSAYEVVKCEPEEEYDCSKEKLQYWSQAIKAIEDYNFWPSLAKTLESYLIDSVYQIVEKLNVKPTNQINTGIRDLKKQDLPALSKLLEEKIRLLPGVPISVLTSRQLKDSSLIRPSRNDLTPENLKQYNGFYKGLEILPKNMHPSGVTTGALLCLLISNIKLSDAEVLVPCSYIDVLEINQT